jgi:hypothetical protein
MWYDEAREQVKAIYGADWKLFCGFLSATSAHTALSANVTLARKAYNQHKSGLPFSGFIAIHQRGLELYLKTGKLLGRKTNNFYQNLLGDYNSVTVDIWIARRYGYAQVTDQIYTVIELQLRFEAALHHLCPAEYQAMLWVEIRGTNNNFAEYLQQGRLF